MGATRRDAPRNARIAELVRRWPEHPQPLGGRGLRRAMRL
jgi:hypothetical protein